MGLFIAIEGTDGSGKQTQTQLLASYFRNKSKKVKLISFPVYKSESSALVKMYLAGRFGNDPNNINPYTASVFYAVDRVASYMEDWKRDITDPDTIVIADRFTGSNAVYQGAKFDDDEQRNKFIKWLFDFEHTTLGIPCPDITLWLNVPDEAARVLRMGRANKATGDKNKQDIHESNETYLTKCNGIGRSIAKKYNWVEIECAENGQMLAREIIQQKIIDEINKF